MLVLGIETSCDETGASVVKDGSRILSNTVASSLDFHRKYGGVIPEIATRYQLETISFVARESMRSARASFKDIGLIAVTQGPGLIGPLLVGISFSKSLGYSLGIPVIGVNHLWAHIYSGLIGRPDIKFPVMGLVVSGGHTALVLCEDIGKFRLLGQTRDDAIGEAFDKVSKVLGLGYPGGPAIEKAAADGDPAEVKFTVPRLGGGSYDFSFSGIKTAVLYYVKGRKPDKRSVSGIAAGFQKAAVASIVETSIAACRDRKVARLIVGGGVSANKALRRELYAAGAANGIDVVFPQAQLSLDNGAMVAATGYLLHKKGKRSGMYLSAEADLGI